jgi:hypothetical protein
MRSKSHNNKSYIKSKIKFTAKLSASLEISRNALKKNLYKFRLYITYRENYLRADKAVSHNKKLFWGGGGSARLLKSENKPDFPYKNLL